MMQHTTICAPGGVFTSQSRQRYRLLHLLGQGGVGQVFEAAHIDSGQKVAIKLLHPPSEAEASNTPDEIFMFIHRLQLAHELRLCAQVRHPNIVPVLDHGFAGNGFGFAVFALLPGLTLKERLIQKGALTPQESGEVMGQVLAALVGLHESGIVHRDLKPQNIMLNRIGTGTQVTLFDFGIAATLPGRADAQSADMSLPGSNACLCSPAYSAPEQLRGAAPSTKADLYAWGLLLLECLTGQAAVRGHSVAEICHKQLCNEIRIPPGLQHHPLGALLRRVLHKDPLLREADAKVLYRDLLQIDWLNIALDLQEARTGRFNADCCGLTQPCEWGEL